VGCTPVIVHHTNKGGTFALSAGIKAACDNMWLFSQYGNNPNLRNLKVSKTRDGIEDYQVECFPENNFHYEVKKTKKVNDAGEESQSIQYPVWMIPLIQILMDGKVILRLELAKRTATKSPRMSQFKNSFDIQISKKSYSEEWQATPEQIKVWRTNGVKPLESGSVRDILNEESEEE